MPSTPTAIATRLNRLIDVIHPRSRGPYTPTEITAAINAGRTLPGTSTEPVALTPADLAALRAGQPTAATDRHLDAVAAFFGLSKTYFTDDDRATVIDRELRLVELCRDADDRALARLARDSRRGELSTEDAITVLESASSAAVSRSGKAAGLRAKIRSSWREWYAPIRIFNDAWDHGLYREKPEAEPSRSTRRSRG